MVVADESATPTVGEGFSSTVYGYSAVAPSGWSVEPATSQWSGADIDHTAAYADQFGGAGSGLIFTIGTPTTDPLREFAEAHVAWVEVNRGCARASESVDAVLDGVPAMRAALACPAGIYGPTLVNKAVVVRDGLGVIFTSFSPASGSDTFPVFDEMLDSVRWSRP